MLPSHVAFYDESILKDLPKQTEPCVGLTKVSAEENPKFSAPRWEQCWRLSPHQIEIALRSSSAREQIRASYAI